MRQANTTPASLNDILATRVKMMWPHRINFKHTNSDEFKNAKQWCEENCQGIWKATNGFHEYFQFEDERDAMMFALRWAALGA